MQTNNNATDTDNYNKILNVPNTVTMIRFAGVGLYLYLFFTEHIWAAFVVFVVIAATDVLDGYLARTRGEVTLFGKIFDPVVDKVLAVAVLFTLTMDGLIPLWLVITITSKELLMLVAGLFVLGRGIVIPAEPIGKAGTFVFSLSVVLTFFHQYTAPIYVYAQYAALAFSLASLVTYAAIVVRRWGKQER